MAEALSRPRAHLNEIDRRLAAGGERGQPLALELTGIAVARQVLVEPMREPVREPVQTLDRSLAQEPNSRLSAPLRQAREQG